MDMQQLLYLLKLLQLMNSLTQKIINQRESEIQSQGTQSQFQYQKMIQIPWNYGVSKKLKYTLKFSTNANRSAFANNILIELFHKKQYKNNGKFDLFKILNLISKLGLKIKFLFLLVEFSIPLLLFQFLFLMLWDPNAPFSEKTKLEQYLKSKIEEAFSLFYDKKKGFIEKKEVPYVMRYLGHFPSEAQVRDHVLPQIQQDDPSENINYKKFQPYMLRVLKEGEYKPDDPQTLMAAFKILDPENKGYIEIQEMKRHLQTSGIQFGSKQTQDFIDFATSKDPNATVIYYQDYLSRLYSFIDKHLQGVMKGYGTYKAK